jgi:hypothetical protein
MKTRILLFTAVVLPGCLAAVSSVFAQGTAFTYQGQLRDGSGPATGTFDLAFKLWNASSGGSQVGTTITMTGQAVTNGLFTTPVDFGGVFNGSPYWLELGVRTNGAAAFTTLIPRQELTPTPYAITAENVDGLVPASQLTGTLPAGALSGTYGDPITLNNAGNGFVGNGSGLTSLNASQLTGGTVADARLAADVALTDVTQIFTGSNIFSGNAGNFIVNNNYSPINTGLFTGLSLQYYIPSGEGAIMSAYNDGYGYLSFYTKQGGGYPIAKQVIIDQYGGVAIDQQNYNNGALNNGTTNGVGLTFGTGSGEGIASQRTAGLNQYGLDFYTDFAHRMSILNNGFVGIGTTNPAAQLDVESAATIGVQGVTASTTGSANAVYGIVSSASPGGYSAGVRGQNNGTGGLGIGVYGSQNGSGWGVYGTAPSGIGVYGSSTSGTALEGSSGTGTGVYASSSSGPALTIGNGGFQVAGAGKGTPTAAFTVVSSSTNSFYSNAVRINNPLCDGKPNAILLVTHNVTGQSSFAYNNHPIGLWYDFSGYWEILNEDVANMPTNIAFNVLIINP